MEYMDRADFLWERESELITEAKQTFGMLAEARSKGLLFIEKLKKEKKQRKHPSKPLQESVNRLFDDVDRYSERFDEITEELKGVYYELDQISRLDDSEGV